MAGQQMRCTGWQSLVAIGFLSALVLNARLVRGAITPLAADETLQDLIDKTSPGGIPGGIPQGVQIGDKIFYDFSYSASTTFNGSPTPTNPAPAAHDISVSAAPGMNVGIEFTATWYSTGGFNQDSVIQYRVHVADPTGQTVIDAVKLSFNGDAPQPATTPQGQALTAAAVSEKIFLVNPDGTLGTTAYSLSTFDNGITQTDQASIDIPGSQDVAVSKDVMAHSAAANAGGGVSDISIVDNAFHQKQQFVPEPTALGLLLLALPLMRRRA